MTLRHALLILESHQKWRMGDEFSEATEPKVLTEAINTILQYHVGSTTALIDQVPDVRKMVEISDEEIDNASLLISSERMEFIKGAKWVIDKIKNQQK